MYLSNPGSWRNGMGFNALIHRYHPNLIDIASLHPKQHKMNLLNAFSVAEKHLGISRILSPEDVDADQPDEDSITLYLAMYCSVLTQSNSATCEPRRQSIHNNGFLENRPKTTQPKNKISAKPLQPILITEYHELQKTTFKWVLKQIQNFSEDVPTNTYEVQKKLEILSFYRHGEKQAKYRMIQKLSDEAKNFNELFLEIYDEDAVFMSTELIIELENVWKLLDQIEQEWEGKLKKAADEFSNQETGLDRSKPDESNNSTLKGWILNDSNSTHLYNSPVPCTSKDLTKPLRNPEMPTASYGVYHLDTPKPFPKPNNESKNSFKNSANKTEVLQPVSAAGPLQGLQNSASKYYESIVNVIQPVYAAGPLYDLKNSASKYYESIENIIQPTSAGGPLNTLKNSSLKSYGSVVDVTLPLTVSKEAAMQTILPSSEKGISKPKELQHKDTVANHESNPILQSHKNEDASLVNIQGDNSTRKANSCLKRSASTLDISKTPNMLQTIWGECAVPEELDFCTVTSNMLTRSESTGDLRQIEKDSKMNVTLSTHSDYKVQLTAISEIENKASVIGINEQLRVSQEQFSKNEKRKICLIYTFHKLS